MEIPLVVQSAEGDDVVIGLSRWSKESCDIEDDYDVFARVSNVRPWIEIITSGTCHSLVKMLLLTSRSYKWGLHCIHIGVQLPKIEFCENVITKIADDSWTVETLLHWKKKSQPTSTNASLEGLHLVHRMFQ
ncbi:Serine protease trypsin-like protein [Phytophthora megakarya]|uniref:Serine protease trypsin-like protein n=1 Tax=Phytophthora megakarya TaxID=4795 RepID=A0A225VVE1_9STRA|nr:Serine protease trypsin-like protein [Phytophthora megakarya]